MGAQNTEALRRMGIFTSPSKARAIQQQSIAEKAFISTSGQAPTETQLDIIKQYMQQTTTSSKELNAILGHAQTKLDKDDDFLWDYDSSADLRQKIPSVREQDPLFKEAKLERACEIAMESILDMSHTTSLAIGQAA
jgi:hypothetical protein